MGGRRGQNGASAVFKNHEPHAIRMNYTVNIVYLLLERAC